jgi:amino-acid N-acetyltransferase
MARRFVQRAFQRDPRRSRGLAHARAGRADSACSRRTAACIERRMEIETLGANDFTAAADLLAANDLPIDDLRDPSIALFAARNADGTLAGVVGLQRCDGGVALLRSLAVAPAARSTGIGARLCERVVADARERDLEALYLLTTGARDYFTRHGFAAVARDAVPAPIRATSQFSSLCPSTAVVMVRPITR